MLDFKTERSRRLQTILVFVLFIAHRRFRIQLHNFVLAIAAASRRARSLARAV